VRDAEIDVFARVSVAPEAISKVPEPVTEATERVELPLIVSVAPEAISKVPEPVRLATEKLELPLIVSVYPEGILRVPEPETEAIDNDILFSTTAFPLISREPLPLIATNII
jgi:hypothetical protein